jgi:hypothetical protein
MNCPNCNKPISTEDKFCGHCGYNLKINGKIADNTSQDDLKNIYIILLTFVGSFILAGFLSNIFTSSQNQHPEQQSQSEVIITTSSEEINQGNIAEKEQIVENKQHICEPPNIFCNNICWTPCPKGERFVCPSKGDAYCEPEGSSFIKTNQESKENKSQSLSEISQFEIEPYIDAVAQLTCYGPNYTKASASLFKVYDKGNTMYLILTNLHAIPENAVRCEISIQGRSGNYWITKGNYNVDHTNILRFNNFTDVAVLKITSPLILLEGQQYVDIPNLNYKLSDLPLCSILHPLGSPVVVLGYPAFSEIETDIGGVKGTMSSFTITKGTISAYDSTPQINRLPDVNYFVTAKIDSGNSGGIALSKNKVGHLCVLGIPTWISLGVYENQGIVQSMHNVLYTSK